MTAIQRTDSHNREFRSLIKQLDLDLKERYGALQNEYDKYNKIESLDTVVVAMTEGKAVGCGCFKQFDEQSVEVKRMFVAPEARRRGIGARILAELETWALERGYKRAVLETGKDQPEAITLYRKSGYVLIENYGQYAGFEMSVCFAKEISTDGAGKGREA